MLNLILSLLFSSLFLTNVYQKTQVELIINNGKSDKGLIRVLVFKGSEGFPEDPAKAFQSFSFRLEGRRAIAKIVSLPPGKYAITAFHDEDENGEISKNAFGYPTDRFGFSNNPKIFFSIPSFEKCLFEVIDGKTTRQIIELR